MIQDRKSRGKSSGDSSAHSKISSHPSRIALVSTYVPKKCGIATYTRDLTEELISQGHQITLIAMDDITAKLTYPPIVGYVISQKKLKDYEKTAEALNTQDIDFVHVQHEFGLFGGEDGDYILKFAKLLKKTLITTFHTILIQPSPNQKYIIQELSRLSRAVIVMEAIAQDRLESIYGINPHDIHTIFHGVPNIDEIHKKTAQKKLGYENTFLILANNLISRNKGFEYVISALPKVIQQIPQVMFSIVGETHPIVKLQEGESYRKELQSLVEKLGVQNHVQFINKYLTLDQLRSFLAAADIYITPYLDPQQITSGTLSYAIGGGKACISTPYIYAEDILSKRRGILVPFRNDNAIAKAIMYLYKNPQKRTLLEKRAHKFGQEMRWPKVADKHARLYHEIQERHGNISRKVKLFIQKDLNLSYLEFLTDPAGIVQHAHYIIPESRFGYSTDDNARALIVVSELYQHTKSPKLLELVKIYLTFLRFAQEPNGRFHTFLNVQRRWIDNDDIADPYGKAIWALGHHLYRCKSSPFFRAVHSMFKASMHHIDVIRDLRAAAYTILGLYCYIKALEKKKETAKELLEKMNKLADFMLMFYSNYHDETWEWFEEKITYDNFRLPQALFAAYLVTKNPTYKEVGIKTLDFVTQNNFDSEKNFFDFVGQDGWLAKGGQKAPYDQQPLEASAAVEAFVYAYQATNEKKYLEKAFIAFQWFFGRNRNHTSLYDEKSGGIFDGLTSTGVNLNEGSESIVTFLMAHHILKEFYQRESKLT